MEDVTNFFIESDKLKIPERPKKSFLGKKELKKNLILLIIAIFVGLIFLEFSLALFYPQKLYNECYESNPNNSSTWRVKLDSKIGWVLKPNYSGCLYQPDTNKIVYQTHNSKGIRLNEEISYEKGDKKRVILLGDSMVEGFGLDDSETIAVKLQENLGKEYEVIPLASRGYSTGQEMLLLREEGLKYNPDLVILFFYPNDFSDNVLQLHMYADQPSFYVSLKNRSKNLTSFGNKVLYEDNEIILNMSNYPTNTTWKEGFGPKRIPLSTEKPLSAFILKYSHLYSLWYHIESDLNSPYFKFIFLKNKKSYHSRATDNLDFFTEKIYHTRVFTRVFLALKIIYGIKKTSDENNFEFIVVSIPHKREVNKDIQKRFLNQWSDVNESFFEFRKVDYVFESYLDMKGIDSKYSIEYIGLYDLAENNFDEFYFKTDAHWSPSGVKLSADYITEELKKRKLI